MEPRTPVRCSLLVNAHKHGLLTPGSLDVQYLTPRLLKNLKRRVNLKLHSDKHRDANSAALGTLQAINGRISQLTNGDDKEIDQLLSEEDDAVCAYLCHLVSPCVICSASYYATA
jgi:hypothetical protein